MKWIKLFEEFEKFNNQEGTLITEDDIIKCIKEKGVIYVKIIKGIKDIEGVEHNEKDPLRPENVDQDFVTVTIQGHQFDVDLKDIIKIEF